MQYFYNVWLDIAASTSVSTINSYELQNGFMGEWSLETIT